MNSADLFSLIAIFLFAALGWLKGFVKSVIGPLSFIAGIIIAVFYFQKTHNPAAAFTVAFLAPIILSLLSYIILKILQFSKAPENRKLFWVSRLGGSGIQALWGVGAVLVFFLFVSLIPLKKTPFEPFKNLILQSRSYALADKLIVSRIPPLKGVEVLISIPEDPKKAEAVKNRPAFQDFYNDPKMQDIFSDEKTVRQIKEKNMAKLLTNPKIQEIFKDEKLMKKILTLSEDLAALENPPAEKPFEPAQIKTRVLKDGTKIIEFEDGRMEVK